jgi:CRISPR type IV-associated protein Csf3
MYKITVYFETNIAFTTPICLDSVVAWAWLREQHGGPPPQPAQLSEDDIIDLSAMPIQYDGQGVPLASMMLFDRSSYAVDEQRYYKRWDNQHDHLARFNGKREVDTGRGHYKSYSLALQVKSIPCCEFFFEGDGPAVKQLLEDYVFAMGKKTSQGYGIIRTLSLQEVSYEEYNPIPLMRPYPVRLYVPEAMEDGHGKAVTGWRAPYWHPANQELCWVPEGFLAIM